MRIAKYRLGAGLTLAVIASMASAHVTVVPKSSSPGAWEKYDLRMPNEKKIDTVALDVRFPSNLRVVSFQDEPGWTVKPAYDAAGKITGARWTGKLPPERFVEFGLIAVNPKEEGDLVWSATQTYADGTVVDWSGPEGSKTPAPKVVVKPAGH